VEDDELGRPAGRGSGGSRLLDGGHGRAGLLSGGGRLLGRGGLLGRGLFTI
jgi:hypothetical protein